MEMEIHFIFFYFDGFPKSQPVEEELGGGGGRRPFLRRGMGLARFNLPQDPSQQPSRVRRSQSQPKLSQVEMIRC